MKANDKGRSHDRSKENTQLSISLPKSLRDRIEAAALAEDRSISSYLRVHLTEILDHRENMESAS